MELSGVAPELKALLLIEALALISNGIRDFLTPSFDRKGNRQP